MILHVMDILALLVVSQLQCGGDDLTASSDDLSSFMCVYLEQIMQKDPISDTCSVWEVVLYTKY